MSSDIVDDLEAAEETIADLTAALVAVRDFRLSNPWTGLDDGPAELRDRIDQAAAFGSVYCRPSCGEGCDVEYCGCPHHSRTG